MKLYEINEQINNALEQAIDPETGEIIDGWQDVISDLSLAKDDKALNVGVAIRMIGVEVDAISDEQARLQRMKVARINRIDSLKQYLAANLEQGSKLKDHRVSLYWMKSKSVQVDEGVLLAEKYQRITVEPDKKAIKAAIEIGLPVDGARLVENNNLVVR